MSGVRYWSCSFTGRLASVWKKWWMKSLQQKWRLRVISRLMYCVKNEQVERVVNPLRDLHVCTRLLFSSFGRHWYKVSLYFVQLEHGTLQISLLHRSRQDGEIKSCLAQKRLRCERHVTELQRLRILDHHGSEMKKYVHQCWYASALHGKEQTAPNATAHPRDLFDASRQDLRR